MPIKRENKDRYPADWSTRIRPAILERTGNRCEECGVENYSVGWRRTDGSFVLATVQPSSEDARRWIETHQIAHPPKLIIIILTIAHLDHTPENNDPANLRAWCQRCHNRYDQRHRQANAAKTRRAKQRQQSLPL
jgi:hypothetical protein